MHCLLYLLHQTCRAYPQIGPTPCSCGLCHDFELRSQHLDMTLRPVHAASPSNRSDWCSHCGCHLSLLRAVSHKACNCAVMCSAKLRPAVACKVRSVTSCRRFGMQSRQAYSASALRSWRSSCSLRTLQAAATSCATRLCSSPRRCCTSMPCPTSRSAPPLCFCHQSELSMLLMLAHVNRHLAFLGSCVCQLEPVLWLQTSTSQVISSMRGLQYMSY